MAQVLRSARDAFPFAPYMGVEVLELMVSRGRESLTYVSATDITTTFFVGQDGKVWFEFSGVTPTGKRSFMLLSMDHDFLGVTPRPASSKL